jgi:chorismate mutase
MLAVATDNDQRLWAVRGATTVGANDAEKVLSSTEELMRELLERNSLDPDRIVSCIFTSTADLNAEFPAVAARNLGLDGVPLLCAREIDVPGAMRSVIRVLVHYYAPAGHEPAHTYLGKAQELRSDLHAAQ